MRQFCGCGGLVVSMFVPASRAAVEGDGQGKVRSMGPALTVQKVAEDRVVGLICGDEADTHIPVLVSPRNRLQSELVAYL
eukprot:COSAG02_NODE_38_length_48090_cov_107.207060_18_plen_80_part_00